jgi:hypothetical protein
MDNYATTLAGVVEAGRAGAESARALGEAVGNLATSLNIALPGAGTAASSVTQLASDLYAIAAREWAAHVVEKRLEELDPKVQEVARILAADLGNLKNIAWASRTQALTNLSQDSEHLRRVNDLKARRAREAHEVLNAPLVATPPQLNLGERLKLLRDIDQTLELETKTPGYMDYLSRRAELETAFADQSAVLDQAVLLLHAWAGAHHQILLAVREKRPPSLQELTQVAADLQEVYKQVHLKGKP